MNYRFRVLAVENNLQFVKYAIPFSGKREKQLSFARSVRPSLVINAILTSGIRVDVKARLLIVINAIIV